MGQIPENKIICGAAKEVLQTLPNESINCSISSPPYWALRDYGVDGQLGLEKTFEEYISKLCDIYDEVRRVLRKDGTCFVNLGDTYGGTKVGNTNTNAGVYNNPGTFKKSGGVDKSLCLIPQRFAIEMVNRGWILRNVIIWHKPNPMPSSAKDRFTVDFEYVYFFVKSKKYWFEPQYEPYVLPLDRWGGIYTDGNVPGSKYLKEDIDPAQLTQRPRSMRPNALGRNKRTVFWTIPTQPYPEAHFATYPEKLVEPMIKAGCPEFICTKCGKAREKIFEQVGETTTEKAKRLGRDNKRGTGGKLVTQNLDYSGGHGNNIRPATFIGYTDCGCNADWRPGVVLDPFAGSGTTLQVAAKLNRNWLGIELKPEYIEMAEKRATQGETGIPVKEQRQGQGALFPIKSDEEES